VSKPIWIRLRSVLERDADATSVELSRESAEEMLAEIKRLSDENNSLRAVLQRVRRWGSPMVKGYIDGALGRQAGGGDPLADDQVGEVRELEAQG
jgi:hypothetical protein